MDNNFVNKLIFDTLSARKSILIEGVGTVVVARKGSNVSNPKKKRDFPRYELIINNSPASVDLKEVMSDAESYKNWFVSVCKVKGTKKIITIPNCVEIKMKSYIVKSIQCSAELDLQLNPFLPKKKSNRNVNIAILSLIILVFVVAGSYMILDFVHQPSQPIAQKITIPEKVVYVPEQNEILDFDTTKLEKVINIDTVKIDTVAKIVVPKTDENGLTEPIKGQSYMVIGSFKTLNEAINDKKRLLRIYDDITINTTIKVKGGYINYIYSSSSYDEAMSLREKFDQKYDKIKGIWVYLNIKD